MEDFVFEEGDAPIQGVSAVKLAMDELAEHRVQHSAGYRI